ncbi:MAG: hypothetical protein J7578_22040, partial [Chitinophagaceae bacterium]|nr:hypothetical protein [Chitinophagaceae bacterium]
VQEKRTSFNLTPGKPACFYNNTDIRFDFMLRSNMPIYFGYLLRIITEEKKNIDIVYNERQRLLNFITGEKYISCPIDSIGAFNHWNQATLHFNIKERTVEFFLNGHSLGKSNTETAEQLCTRIIFGANDLPGFQTADVAPFLIREVSITENGKQRFHFPLDESGGTEALEKVADKKYAVINPGWIAPMHQNWQKVYAARSGSVAALAFNSDKDLLYIIAGDSLYEYSLKDNTTRIIRLTEKRKMAYGNQAIYNNIDKKLYNFYIDDKSVSVYDTTLARWDKGFRTDPLTVFWQANKFISTADTSLYTIAGYGQLNYKNRIQRYNFNTQRWDSIQPKGDFFMPRYLAALGVNTAGDMAYILGGYGSNTGDQMLNPRHTYDLLAYDVRKQQFKKLTEFSEPEHPFVFSNSLILEPGTDNYYTLIYPNDRFNSHLQLIKGSLHSNQYEPMADTIPYQFLDVESFVDLFYSPISKKLLAVTLHTNKDTVTDVNVYALNFPPNKMIAGTAAANTQSIDKWLYILIGFVATSLVILFLRRKKKQIIPAAGTIHRPEQITPLAEGTVNLMPAPIVPVSTADTTAIYLFGQFEIVSRDKQNLTALFSPLLKELFLLILLHTCKDGKGISPEKLLEMLWPDKSSKDARNNYQVNIAKLKTVCEKIGGINIKRDTGHLRLLTEEENIFIDYKRFRELTSGAYTINNQYVIALLDLIQRGGFLQQLHYNWLDDFKSEVSGIISDIFVKYATAADPEANAELTLRFANAVFLFDQLNEEALVYKCKSLMTLGRHGMAKDTFSKFAKEYRENYGADFEKTFIQITGNS